MGIKAQMQENNSQLQEHLAQSVHYHISDVYHHLGVFKEVKMYFYKVIQEGIITQIGSGSKETKQFTPITQEDYNSLLAKMQSKPEDTLEQKYVLDGETEEYKAIETTHEDKVDWYRKAVEKGDMTVDEVPEEYRAEVKERMPNNSYGIPNEKYIEIVAAEQQNYRNQLAQEVAEC